MLTTIRHWNGRSLLIILLNLVFIFCGVISFILGMVRKDRTFIDAIKSYYASDIKDTEKHDTEVEHMYYIEKLRHLLVMERDSKRFKVYNARTGKWI
jgi:hypothetical protein